MARTKKKPKALRQIDVITSIRRAMPPGGKVIKTKRDTPYRKRKHKGKTEE
jgi:uncharacterized protein with von Willebrand factor type A (vWA) domain